MQEVELNVSVDALLDPIHLDAFRNTNNSQPGQNTTLVDNRSTELCHAHANSVSENRGEPSSLEERVGVCQNCLSANDMVKLAKEAFETPLPENSLDKEFC